MSVSASRVDFHGYSDCIQLDNGHARVVLGHQCGGRVLEYSLGGENAMALNPEQAGWTWAAAGGRDSATGDIDPWGGRFDIGPERVTPAHPTLWLGAWSAEVTTGGARLTSEKDPATGVRLVRDFALADDSSRLTCTQTIRNESGAAIDVCHWGRTFVPGGGVALVPLTRPSRFPNGYVMYDAEGTKLDFEPSDPAVVVSEGMLRVIGTPLHPKLGMDSTAGWLAYLPRSGDLFVKRFPVFPDRVYNEIAGLTISLWCLEGRVCEIEPIGPRERLAPGERATFTEEWWLIPVPEAERRGRAGDGVDVDAITERVARATA